MSGDRRFGQRWSTAQRLKNDAIYALLCGIDAIARRLPPHWTARLLGGLARIVVGRSAVARDNVARVFPGWTPSARRDLLARHADRLAEHASAALEVAWGRRASSPLDLSDGSGERLQQALDEGRGVVVATAHLGSWERVAQTLFLRGLPLTAISREPYDRRLGRWLGPLRGAMPTIPRSAPGAPRAMVRCLRRGGLLLVPMDLATRGVDTHPSPFLGLTTAIVTGPARLALHTGAAVVIATYTRKGARELLRIDRLEPLPTGSDATRALTERLARGLTDAVMRCPEEWLWLHPRWTEGAFDPLYSPHEGREAPRS